MTNLGAGPVALPAGDVLVTSGPLTDGGAVPTDTTVWLPPAGGLTVRASDFAYLADAPPVALAHRGGAAYAPNVGLENTLAAFGRAVDMGYRYLETDVHATRDGHLVAFHDPVLDRVSDARAPSPRCRTTRVREARVGGSEPIPLLGELFERFPDVRVNIDIKSDTALEATIREVRRHDADGPGVHRVVLRAPAAGRPRRARAAGRDGGGAGGHGAAPVLPVGAQPPAAHPRTRPPDARAAPGAAVAR